MDVEARAIIIPALNEEGSLPGVLTRALGFGTVIVVDDGSSDRTSAVAESLCAVTVRNNATLGYDAAIARGFQEAKERKFTYAITIDADGQLPVERIPDFFSLLERGSDLVVGSRNKLPRVAEKLFAALLRLGRIPVADPFCGMKGYRMSLYENAGCFSRYKSFGTELLIYALNTHARIDSLPIEVKPRDGRSRIGGRVTSEAKLFVSAVRGCLQLCPGKRVSRSK